MTSGHEVLGGLHDYEWQAKEKLRPKTADEPQLLGRFARLLFEERSINKMKDGFGKLVAWWKKERAQDKADRAYNGSFAEISHTVVPLEEMYYIPEQPAADADYMQPLKSHRYGERNAYRSVYARETAKPEHVDVIDDEMAEVMQAAVDRARLHLGAVAAGQGSEGSTNLPDQPKQQDMAVPIGQGDNLRYRDDPEADAALLRRLEAAYAQPAVQPLHEKVEPTHEKKVGRHRRSSTRRRLRLPIVQHRNDDLTTTSGK
ncbi:MAG TPA: hypothetical protein VM581_01320 [Magnetospirillaceae bacterium]|nr:hypothetical protein [Magnetospirillaceae bacterium]